MKLTIELPDHLAKPVGHVLNDLLKDFGEEIAEERFDPSVGYHTDLSQVEEVLKSLADGLLSSPGGIVAPSIGGVEITVE